MAFTPDIDLLTAAMDRILPPAGDLPGAGSMGLAQEVIDRCWALGEHNPIVSIHDVGAGGLSNALPELVHDHDRGAKLSLRAIPSAEPGMSPVEIWEPRIATT